jgi:beta-glucuronidase
MADELGLMVWSEIPVYWTIEWENPQTLANATHQLSQMIIRDQNRAAVIIWSMANETPVSDARNSFLKHLADTARSLDNTRFISAAMEKTTSPDDSLTLIVKDPFAEYVDIVSFNQYLGWYDGLPEKCNRVTWQIDYDKPVVISEFGGGALAGFHGDSITRWSEEFLEDLYIQNLKMIENIPEVSGTTPWLLADFRSPRRLLWGIQDGFNRKGLISETGHKKKAFWVLKSFYDKKELEYNADE